MKVLIASTNNAKIEGAKKALSRYYDNVEIVGITANSGVPDQPVNAQIYEGAKNRIDYLVNYAKENNISVDYYMAIESGIANLFNKWMITNIAIIVDNDGCESCGTSPSFPVPNHLVNKIITSDLNKTMSKLFTEDDKRRSHGGAIGLLTHEVVSRIDLTESAFLMALTSHINDNMWK